jgi:hypothetical protein
MTTVYLQQKERSCSSNPDTLHDRVSFDYPARRRALRLVRTSSLIYPLKVTPSAWSCLLLLPLCPPFYHDGRTTC